MGRVPLKKTALRGARKFIEFLTGQEFDKEYQFYNYVARLYDPVMGRFITPDSEVPDWYDPQQLNRYAYTRNNPLKYVDPSGHFPEGFWEDPRVPENFESLPDETKIALVKAYMDERNQNGYLELGKSMNRTFEMRESKTIYITFFGGMSASVADVVGGRFSDGGYLEMDNDFNFYERGKYHTNGINFGEALDGGLEFGFVMSSERKAFSGKSDAANLSWTSIIKGQGDTVGWTLNPGFGNDFTFSIEQTDLFPTVDYTVEGNYNLFEQDFDWW